ncbi:MAG: hypothetical protein EOP56_19405 [Sphingobacteriales bacterium]|nr:MAG: hypothetical protein EOP56_19405 [Sphingobacteriales bacterium]
MSKGRFVLILFFTLLSAKSFAGDTTLYDRRVLKVKALFKDLAILKQFRMQSAGDTSLLKDYYVETLNKHVPRPAPGSEYKLEYSVYTIHSVANQFAVDSLILRYPDPSKDSIIDTRLFKSYLANTIIFYLPMYGDLWEGAYFSFKEGSDEMVFFIVAGGEPADYKRKKQYLNAVHRITGP